MAASVPWGKQKTIWAWWNQSVNKSILLKWFASHIAKYVTTHVLKKFILGKALTTNPVQGTNIEVKKN